MVEEILQQIKEGKAEVREILINISHCSEKASLETEICDFLRENINIITESALFGEDATLKLASINIIKSRSTNIIQILLTSEVFIGKMNEFLLTLEKQSNSAISTWCSIISKLNEHTAFSFLLYLPERKKFIKHLLPFLHNLSIMQLVLSICEGMQAKTFLEKYHTTTVFYNALSDGKNIPEILRLMDVMIFSLDRPGHLLQSLAKKSRIDRIFELAISDDIPTSNEAMKLLFTLSSYCDENDCSKGSMFEVIFMHLAERVEELADFICRGMFTRGKDKAIDLLIGMTETIEEFPEEPLYKIVDFLFNEMLKNPLITNIHCALVRLFSAMMERYNGCKEFVKEHNFKEAIIEHSGKRCPYSGHLHAIAKLIIECEEEEEEEEISEEWKAYVEGPYAEMEALINSSYGGICPPKHRIDPSELNIEGKDAGFNTIDIRTLP